MCAIGYGSLGAEFIGVETGLERVMLRRAASGLFQPPRPGAAALARRAWPCRGGPVHHRAAGTLASHRRPGSGGSRAARDSAAEAFFSYRPGSLAFRHARLDAGFWLVQHSLKRRAQIGDRDGLTRHDLQLPESPARARLRVPRHVLNVGQHRRNAARPLIPHRAPRPHPLSRHAVRRLPHRGDGRPAHHGGSVYCLRHRWRGVPVATPHQIAALCGLAAGDSGFGRVNGVRRPSRLKGRRARAADRHV
jgi:hypothetical protein